MTPEEARLRCPELFAIAEELRAAAVADARRYWPNDPEAEKRAAANVRFRCLIDFDGTLLLGKPPEDLVLGPIPPDPREEPAEAPAAKRAPYRGRTR